MSSGHRLSMLRIAATMAIAVAVATVAVFLGLWQYGKHVERSNAQADFEVAETREPVPVDDLVPPGATQLPAGVEWRKVTATGTFDPDSLTILRTRPVDGTPAWQYLAWLTTDSGQSVLIDLAWVKQPAPGDDGNPPVLDADETVTATAVMRVWEPDDGKGAGQSITRITPAQLPTPAGDPVPGYGMLRELCDSDGCVETPVGNPVPLPSLTLGPHLSYAWQWWVFAAMAPVGGILLLRRDARIVAATAADQARMAGSAPPPPTAEPPATTSTRTQPSSTAEPARASAVRRVKRKSSRPRQLSDEEIEDAL